MERWYLPVLLLLGFVVLNGVLMIGLSNLVIRRRPSPIKDQPYESGMPVLGDARERFSVKFYMVAMLFIIFDIEAVFLFPFAVAFNQLGLVALVEMILFMLTVFVAYGYVWRLGGLEWD